VVMKKRSDDGKSWTLDNLDAKDLSVNRILMMRLAIGDWKL